jgi:serine/threonine protein kinase
VQLTSALIYLHAKSIIHRDVKLKNLTLLQRKPDWNDQELRIIDFGLASADSDHRALSTFCGTPAFAAPEMLLSTSYEGSSVDVWSSGVVLYNMVTGRIPFNNVAWYVLCCVCVCVCMCVCMCACVHVCVCVCVCGCAN